MVGLSRNSRYALRAASRPGSGRSWNAAQKRGVARASQRSGSTSGPADVRSHRLSASLPRSLAVQTSGPLLVVREFVNSRRPTRSCSPAKAPPASRSRVPRAGQIAVYRMSLSRPTSRRGQVIGSDAQSPCPNASKTGRTERNRGDPSGRSRTAIPCGQALVIRSRAPSPT